MSAAPMSALLRLAVLRRDAATRAVARAELAHRGAAAEVELARDRLGQVVAEVARRKDGLRAGMVGKGTARRALVDLLDEIAAEDDGIRRAEETLARAESERDHAAEALSEAQAALAAAERLLVRRRHLQAPLLRAARRAREAREEAELADAVRMRGAPHA